MSSKTDTKADARKLTNIDELVAPRPAPDVSVQPMPEVPREEVVKRSTFDPLAINFAQVDIADSLTKKSAPRWARGFAIVFLAVPSVIVWPFLVASIFEGVSDGGLEPMDLGHRLVLFVLITLACGFWPYLLVQKKARK